MEAEMRKRQNDYLTTSNDNTWVESKNPVVRIAKPKNSHLAKRAVEGAKTWAANDKRFREEHPVLATIGDVASVAPFAAAAAPAVTVAGNALAGSTVGQGITTLLTNPYVDAVMTSLGGAHAAQSIASGEADWITALELAPMTRLVKPMYNATADLATNAIDKARWLYNEGNIFNAQMKYNPENFYRAVGQDAIEDANLTGLIRANPNSAFKVPYFGYKRSNPSLRTRARSDRDIIEGSPKSAETWADAWRYDSRKPFIEYKLKNLTSEIRSMKDSEMSQLYTDQEVQALLKERAFWKDLSDHSFRDIREAPTTRPLSTEYFEEISQNNPGWMMEFGTEAFPSNAGSTSVPVDNFVYWRRYPILGWRANSFRTASGSRSSLPKISQK